MGRGPVLVVCLCLVLAFRTIWVFARKPLAGGRWFAAAMPIVGSTAGGVMALFVAPSLCGADLVRCVAASITIISH